MHVADLGVPISKLCKPCPGRAALLSPSVRTLAASRSTGHGDAALGAYPVGRGNCEGNPLDMLAPAGVI